MVISRCMLTWEGNTWNFRDDLEANGVSGARSEDDGKKYFRFLCDVDVTSSEQKDKVFGLIDIFQKQVMRVVVDPAAEGDVAKFLEELRGYSCVHFA